MSPADMIQLASAKVPGCFSADSQSYNHILDLLEDCHRLYIEAIPSQDHFPSYLLRYFKQLENACEQYIGKAGANKKRKKAVGKLYGQIRELDCGASPYFTGAEGTRRLDDRNFNGRTHFAGTQDLIECRHIALQEIFERQIEDLKPAAGMGKAHRADRRVDQRGTLAHMAQHMNPRLEERHNEIRYGARENYAVDHSKWGEFFHEMFSRMPIPSTRYMLMTSSQHAMTVRLRAKQDLQGQVRYVINFHDPNRTLVDERFYTHSLEQVKGLQIGNFLDIGEIASYFGGPTNENREQVSLFQKVPNIFHTRPLDEPRDYGASDSWPVKMFLPEQRTFRPDVAYHLLTTGLPLNEIRARFEHCPREKVFSLLAAKRADGTPGHFMAQQNGHAAAIKAHGKLVFEAVEKGLIDKRQVFELLAAKRADGAPGHFMAQQNGHAAAIEAHGKLVFAAVEKGLIDKRQVFELLAAKKADGTPGHYAAHINGHAAAIEAHGKLVFKAVEKDLIDKQQVFELLAAEDDDGLTGWHFVTQYTAGHATAIKAHDKLVFEAAERDLIDEQQVSKLLGICLRLFADGQESCEKISAHLSHSTEM